MIKLFIDFALCALVAFVVFRLFQRYRAAEGSWYKRAWTALLGSWTIGVQYIVGVLTYISPYIEQLADYLNIPEVGTFVHEYLPTDASGKAVMAILIITIAARLRKVGS